MTAVNAQGVSLANWLDRIARLRSGPEIELGLDRIRRVYDRLSVQPRCPTFLVGGTNGKGSTVAFLDAILRAAGARVARYSSPHLVRFNERIVINGREVEDNRLIRAFERVDAARQAAGGVALTFFEFTTLAAFECFAQEALDVWVIEVGLGGRLDATNVLDADCAVITSIGLDHREWLGPTREHIAREKAGIFRPKGVCVIGERDVPASLTERVTALEARALWLGRDFGWQIRERTPMQWHYWCRVAASGEPALAWRHALPMPALRGRFQLNNAATALAALDAVRTFRPEARLPAISSQAVRDGLLQVAWPARFQVLPGRPTMILDVAHNEEAARVLAETLDEMPFFPRTHAVFSMLADKDVEAVVRVMAPKVDLWYIAVVDSVRAAPLVRLRTALAAAGVPPDRRREFATIAEAVQAARTAADTADRIIVFGSFLTVSAVLAAELR
ncbi:MAG: bifunctional tetrahydrofolate synthase/dihydrofolate synthase [Burkholderiales bacterium]|nr:bifunctional tetrahydrofolate synthase/dihydrofolate synthase [Burkholderiales bacterium]